MSGRPRKADDEEAGLRQTLSPSATSPLEFAWNQACNPVVMFSTLHRNAITLQFLRDTATECKLSMRTSAGFGPASGMNNKAQAGDHFPPKEEQIL